MNTIYAPRCINCTKQATHLVRHPSGSKLPYCAQCAKAYKLGQTDTQSKIIVPTCRICGAAATRTVFGGPQHVFHDTHLCWPCSQAFDTGRQNTEATIVEYWIAETPTP